MTKSEMELFLKNLGVPEENISTMASQLEKRAHQLAERKGQTYEEAMIHLINLLKQGWAAKQKNIQ
jgi:hypothetical protein